MPISLIEVYEVLLFSRSWGPHEAKISLLINGTCFIFTLY